MKKPTGILGPMYGISLIAAAPLAIIGLITQNSIVLSAALLTGAVVLIVWAGDR